MSEKIELSLVPVSNVTRTRFIEKVIKGKEWVSYGDRNTYPDYLWGLYTQCPTLQAIIDAKTEFSIGGGLSAEDGKNTANLKGETVEEVFRKCVFDLHLFGGFALQVIYNRAGDVLELYWCDFSKCRINPEGTKVYFADTWNTYNNAPIEYDVFNPKMTNKTTQIFYYRGISCRSVYPIPSYISAMDAINTEIEIQNYHLNAIRNGFAVNAIVNFNNGVPDEETRKAIEEKINAKFAGSDNAGKTLISWNETKDCATTVERLESDNFDKKFQQLSKDVQEAIFVSSRITSGSLLGRIPVNTGFSRTEWVESFNIFNDTVIKPYQQAILGVLRKIFPERKFNILPFYIEK